jgi:ADP-heptose:LPS heptosyltransferase
VTWRSTDPQGAESAKIRHELIPYIRGRCLDLGCGAEKVWPHFVGVDNFVDQKLFGSNVCAEMRVDTCERLELFGDAQFDCVFSSHLLEHIVDYRAALAEWWRLVRPGGTLILYLPHRDHYPRIGTEGANPDHKHDFAPDDIAQAMASSRAGWSLERNETRAGGQEYSFLQVYRKRTDGHHLHPWKAPAPEKTAAVVRLGNIGDALWAGSVIAHLKAEGYHITLYTGDAGALTLKHDPNIDRIINVPPVYDAAGLVAFFIYEQQKYARFVNLVGVVETRLLPAASDVEFWRPADQRQRMFGSTNYLEALHVAAGVPIEPRQKFYPSPDELARAATQRARLPGPVVVINPVGSTVSKFWPHVQRAIDLLEAAGCCPVILGDLRGATYTTTRGLVVGKTWPLRDALAFALCADVVVGVESALVNAVAFEPSLKVVMLSHSSHTNLTASWANTVALEPTAVSCYPCHRIHRTMEHCRADPETGAAACQAVVSAEQVAELVAEYLANQARGAA